MFALFGKSDTLKYSDKVWKSKAALLAGIIAEALKAIKQSETVILVTWFEDQRQSLIDFIAEHKVPHELWEGIGSSGASSTIHLITSESLANSSNVSKLAGWSAKVKINFLFDGHYPLLPKEADVLEKLKSLNRQHLTVTFCQSLDGALLKHFGGEKMVSLLEQLGLKDDECIEHAMITTSILRAREKLTRQITTEMTARKEEEWFLKNAGN